MVVDKRISRKHLSLHASADGSAEVVVVSDKTQGIVDGTT